MPTTNASTPTRRRSAARRVARGLAESLRSWREERSAAAEKRREEARKARATRKPDGSRGIDRVPDRYRVHPPEPQWLVRHEDANHAQRRLYFLRHGRRVRSTSNLPHVNPARDTKSLKAGRLRKELR